MRLQLIPRFNSITDREKAGNIDEREGLNEDEMFERKKRILFSVYNILINCLSLINEPRRDSLSI